jgi:hypothetical protein
LASFRVFSFFAAFAVIPVAHAISIGGADGLSVSLESNGAYAITVPATNWRFAGTVGAAAVNVQTKSGADTIGTYTEIAFDFQRDVTRHATVRSYWDRAAVLFTVSQSAASANTFAFPNLSEYPKNLSHLSFSGTFAPPSFSNLANESPWAFFDSSANTFILSAASNFMTSVNTRAASGELGAGISSQIASLPAGFQHQTLLVIGKGINRTIETWGNMLTTMYSKRRPANDADLGLSKLSYWTDNGATYYYHMEKSLTYEQTLAAAKNDFDQAGIGLGSLQLDSWFYPKGAGALWSNNGQGIYKYEAAAPPFNSGLAKFQQTIGIPLTTHARWIDASSPYRKTYQMSGNVVIDPKYWDSVADYLANAGVMTYEQDWLNDNAQPAFNLTDADLFLDNMAASLSRRGITMQYCMASPRHFLQSVKYNNLTSIRTSADRMARDKWTDFLYTSRLASAMGIWPFTDNFLSSETAHMLLAALSAGPVGVGDAIGGINAANLLRAVRKDGVIVKPDVPLTPIDASYLNMARGTDTPQIAAAYSDFGESRTIYLFGYTQGANTGVKVRPVDAGAAVGRGVYVYDYVSGTGQVIDSGDTIDRQISGDAMYLVLAPIGDSRMAVVGDAGQFVTMGKKRVTSMKDDGQISMTLAFADGEQSRVITGYSPWLPAVHALEGSASPVKYDRVKQQFRVLVAPGDSGTASLRIERAVRRRATLAQ